MKKINLLLIVIVMSFLFIACSNEQKKGIDTSSINQADGKNDKEGDSEYESYKELPGKIRVNHTTVKYCVDAPGIYPQKSNTGQIVKMRAYSVIYDQYLNISSDGQFQVKLNEIESPKDVIPAMAKQMSATSEKGLIFADEYTVEIIKAEDIKVNSWDMCKTKGKIHLTCEYPLDYESANYVAYSLIKDGYPVYFAVIENPAGEETIDIEELADKIAKTFREYSED